MQSRLPEGTQVLAMRAAAISRSNVEEGKASKSPNRRRAEAISKAKEVSTVTKTTLDVVFAVIGIFGGRGGPHGGAPGSWVEKTRAGAVWGGGQKMSHDGGGRISNQNPLTKRSEPPASLPEMCRTFFFFKPLFLLCFPSRRRLCVEARAPRSSSSAPTDHDVIAPPRVPHSLTHVSSRRVASGCQARG